MGRTHYRMGRRRASLLVAALVTAGTVALGGPSAAGRALAAESCITSGTTATCTYTYSGDEQTFAVPADVSALTVTAYGAAGGGSYGAGQPGQGGLASGVVAVTPGTTLYVEVGGAGGNGGGGNGGGGNGGGFNGGGAGGSDPYGGGGGGASDVRTASNTAANSLSTRLIVAGGGGGAGSSGDHAGGNGGASDQSGSAGGAGADGTPGGGGGQASTLSGGGAGGASTTCDGSNGSLGTGGTGAGCSRGFGGGGGGRYYGGGGGGGGGGDFGPNTGGGGGGGGSYTGSATNASRMDGVASPDGSPNGEVIITYTIGSTQCGSTCDANATPELGSGELLATGLFPLGAVLLYRRRRARRRGPM